MVVHGLLLWALDFLSESEHRLFAAFQKVRAPPPETSPPPPEDPTVGLCLGPYGGPKGGGGFL